MTDPPSRVAGRRSAQVTDHQEHEDAGEQHASDHDELVLGSSSLDQPHHRVGQAQHVGHVQHLLVRSLECRSLISQTVEDAAAAAYKVVHVSVSVVQVGVKLQSLVYGNGRICIIGGEGSTQELLPLPLLGLSGVAPMLEILQSTAKVLDVVL